jgi:hypothetical protein
MTGPMDVHIAAMQFKQNEIKELQKLIKVAYHEGWEDSRASNNIAVISDGKLHGLNVEQGWETSFSKRFVPDA